MVWGPIRVRAAVAAAVVAVLTLACGESDTRVAPRTIRTREGTSRPEMSFTSGVSSVAGDLDVGVSGSPTSGPASGASPRARSTYERYAVGTVETTWVDRSRSLPPRSGMRDGPRTVSVTLYRPLMLDGSSAGGPYPLVVWAHGLDATPDDFDAVLRDWAARGYVIAAPAFPLTRRGAPGGPDRDDYLSQPGDITFVVSRVLSEYGPAGTTRPGLVDPTEIAVAGHSLGAVSALAVVSDRCCIDDRVTAAVVVDGTRLPFPGGGAVRRNVPLLVVHGDRDQVFPIAQGRDLYATAAPPRYMLALAGVPHTPFADRRSRAVTIAAVADFLDLHLGNRPGAAEALRRDADASGLATLSTDPAGAP